MKYKTRNVVTVVRFAMTWVGWNVDYTNDSPRCRGDTTRLRGLRLAQRGWTDNYGAHTP